MKRLILTLAGIFLFTLSVPAAVPTLINYQGMLTDSLGNPLDTTADVTFRIFDVASGGAPFWTETQTVTSVNGLFTVLLGVNTPIDETIFDDADRYIEVQLGASPFLPRTRLASSPFAIKVATVDDAAGGDIAGDLRISGKVGIGNDCSNPGTLAFVAGLENSAYGNYSTIGGGSQNQANGPNNTIGGGAGNTTSDFYSTVAGGNANVANGYGTLIGGGQSNTANFNYSVVAGGFGNSALADGSTVGGGFVDSARGIYSAVLSGFSNQAGNVSTDTGALVGGGYNNAATEPFSFVGGGQFNEAIASHAAICGGFGNVSSGQYSTIAGGLANITNGLRSTVGGGQSNYASGAYATVPGGLSNRAMANYSFAAGVFSKANHDGAVVIAANASFTSTDSVASSGAEQMVLRADGYFYLTNVAGAASIPAGRFLNTSTGGYLTTGGDWTNASDRNSKENFEEVNETELLELISEMDISKWNYKAQGEEVKHIGPVAQDFYEKFGLGTDDKSISTVDASGIALAAIKALYQENQELKKRLEKLESKLE
jgi:hypothetical protein